MSSQYKNRLVALFSSLAVALLVLAGPLALAAPARPQEPPAAAVQADKFPLDLRIPVDPKITVGELPNGLRYFIRENREPKNRADLRLVVNAGSVLEDLDVGKIRKANIIDIS